MISLDGMSEPEQIRHCLYREWLPKRNAQTKWALEQDTRQETYSQRFEKMHGISLEDYHRQCAAKANGR